MFRGRGLNIQCMHVYTYSVYSEYSAEIISQGWTRKDFHEIMRPAEEHSAPSFFSYRGHSFPRGARLLLGVITFPFILTIIISRVIHTMILPFQSVGKKGISCRFCRCYNPFRSLLCSRFIIAKPVCTAVYTAWSLILPESLMVLLMRTGTGTEPVTALSAPCSPPLLPPPKILQRTYEVFPFRV